MEITTESRSSTWNRIHRLDGHAPICPQVDQGSFPRLWVAKVMSRRKGTSCIYRGRHFWGTYMSPQGTDLCVFKDWSFLVIFCRNWSFLVRVVFFSNFCQNWSFLVRGCRRHAPLQKVVFFSNFCQNWSFLVIYPVHQNTGSRKEERNEWTSAARRPVVLLSLLLLLAAGSRS